MASLAALDLPRAAGARETADLCVPPAQAIGRVYLQQAAAILPDRADLRPALDTVTARIREFPGEVFVLEPPRPAPTGSRNSFGVAGWRLSMALDNGESQAHHAGPQMVRAAERGINCQLMNASLRSL
jgi:hypothetical protein